MSELLEAVYTVGWGLMFSWVIFVWQMEKLRQEIRDFRITMAKLKQNGG